MNALTIDLEDYYMVSAFEGVVNRHQWDRFTPRIEQNTYRLLDMLDECSPPRRATGSVDEGNDSTSCHRTGTKATFFCLGWVAERHPGLIREINSRGHEIASHGYDHRMITNMSGAEEFRQDVRRSKMILEDLCGQRVYGYRAPSYSITCRTLWAPRVLIEEGFQYDSSIFPVHHDRYGIPDAPRSPFLLSVDASRGGEGMPRTNAPSSSGFWTSAESCGYSVSALQFYPNARHCDCYRGSLQKDERAAREPGSFVFPSLPSGTLLEFPLSTLRVLGYNLPVAGGGYFRLFPLGFTLWVLQREQKASSEPFVFYIHPWEIDPDQPRVGGVPFGYRFRHYLNLEKSEKRMRRLAKEVMFTSFFQFLMGSEVKPVSWTADFGRNDAWVTSNPGAC